MNNYFKNAPAIFEWCKSDVFLIWKDHQKVLISSLIALLLFVHAGGIMATQLPQQQPTRKITGTVNDATGLPITGANIVVKGTTATTVTNLEGQFSIDARQGATLVVSFVGYISNEIQVGNNLKLDNIILLEDTKSLDEVVVIGFGTTSVRKNSASVATFDAKTIKEVPYTDMVSALQGRVAGVIVQQGSNEPGQNGGSISIRGGGEPLYVIDGFVSTRQHFLSLNKEDIKNTTVLKDAASTAVYGMNAGNGVILVTTKQGENGKLNVNYQGNFATNYLSYPVERMDAYEYAYAINNLNQSLGQGINSFRSPEEMQEIAKNLKSYTNWEETCMRNSAPQSEQVISMTGGTDRLKFYGSLNYFNIDGIYKEDVLKYDRYSYRSNVSSNFDKIGLTIDFNINGWVRDEKYPPASAGTIYSRMRDRTPFEKAYTADGNISNQFDNPLLALKSPGFYKIRTVYNQLASKVNWNVPWVKGWSFGFNGNYNIETQDETDWIETATYYDDAGNATVEQPSNIRISRDSYETDRYEMNFQTDYKKTFAEKHNLQATLVLSMQHYYSTTLVAGSNTFYTTAIHQIQKGDASSITASNTEGEQASIGYVGRLHYDYKNRYLVDFAGRYDGSDNFPSDKRFGFFPSGSLGWALSEENFFKPVVDNKIFDYFKVRGSAGQIGINGADHWAYAYLPTYNYNTNGYVVNGKLVNTVSPGAVPSINMTWYTVTKYDAGIDFTTLDNKLEGSFDWFFETTKGYLSAPNYKYTDPIGYTLPLEVSDAENRKEGLDGSLRYKTKFGEFDFSAGFNFTYYNAIAAKTNEDSVTLANPRIRLQGEKANYYLATGYIGTKFYNTPDEILNNPKRITSRDLRPGDLFYSDINGDGQIDGQDQSRFGHNSSPSFVFGFDVSGGYKGLNIMATIQGTGIRQTYFSNYAMGSEGERRLDYKYQNDFWTPDNSDAKQPRPGNLSLNDNNNYASSDFWARNTGYVRLKSLTISYDLKNTVLRKEPWLNNLTLFASGVNLFAVGPSVQYGDPEANNFDGYAYPMLKTYSIGFQLGF